MNQNHTPGIPITLNQSTTMRFTTHSVATLFLVLIGSTNAFSSSSSSFSSSLLLLLGNHKPSSQQHQLCKKDPITRQQQTPNDPLFIRGGATDLAAAKKASVSAITSAWNHPIVQQIWSFLAKVTATILREFKQLTTTQKMLFVSMFFLGLKVGRSAPSVKRYTNAVDIPSRYFGPNAPCLTGKVVKVSDGDTLRLLHAPTPFHASSLSKGQKLAETTLPIRICSIDTPETAKFGKPGQPFGLEAKQELENLVDGKTIRVRLLQTDQYGRAVAQVFCGRNRCVDEILLKAGLAEVYQGMGAVYGPLGKDKYLQLQDEAKLAKKGMWSQKNRESAAEYKRRTK
jgi:micrococcal nuclease